MNVTWETDYLLYYIIQQEMLTLWNQEISARKPRSVKVYWSKEIDALADMLLELRRARQEFEKERVKELLG